MTTAMGGGYRRTISLGAPVDGDAQVFSSGKLTVYWVAVAADKDGEFLHLFESAVAPAGGETPTIPLGAIQKGDMQKLYHFGDDGISLSALSLGMSQTLATFTVTATPALYLITIGLNAAP